MLWTLTKIRLKAVFSGTGKNSKKGNSKVMKIFLAIILAYAGVCLVAMFAGYFDTMAAGMTGFGFDWLYFAIISMLIVMLGFISTVFAAQSQIFEAKDNDLLLSMPIPPKYILMSRIFALMVIDIVEAIILSAVAGIVYSLHVPLTVCGTIALVLEMVGIVFITVTLSTLFGWIFAFLSSKLRNRSIVTTLFSLAFVALYFMFCTNGTSYVNYLLQNGADVAAVYRKYMIPFYWYGRAVTDGSISSFLLFMGASILVFALLIWVLSKNFTGIATTKKGLRKKAYSQAKNRVRTPKGTLIKKELTRFFTCAAYILNCGLGLVIMLVLTIVLIVKMDTFADAVSKVAFLNDNIGIIAIFAISAINLMNLVSAPSVSLEGDNIWIVQSMPVKTSTILRAKVATHIILCLPFSILLSIAVNVVFGMDILMRIAVVLVPAAASVFVAYLGLICNLVLPKFDWTDETVAIKQSMSVLLTMGVVFGIFITVAVLYFVTMGVPYQREIFACGLLIIFTVASLIMSRYIENKGSKRFEAL